MVTGTVRRSALYLLLAGILLSPAPSWADGLAVARFHPASSQRVGYLTVESAQTLPVHGWEVGLLLDLSNDPFVAREDGERAFSVLETQLVSHVVTSWAPLACLQLGLDVPVYLVQTSGGVDVLGGPDALEGAGIGDLRVVPKWRFFRGREPGRDGVDLALLANVWLPTGDDAAFQGEDFRLEPRLAADWANPVGFGVAVNAGFLLRPSDAQIESLEVRNQLTWGLGVRVPLVRADALDGVPVLQAMLDANGAVTVGGEDDSVQESPAELLLAGRYRRDTWYLTAGGGTGIVEGYGSPDFRAFVGFTYSRGDEAPDTDGDGLLDPVDACPTEPEDVDGFEDSDGCPDPDNDADGLADGADGCPDDAEDVDGFEDDDGCPDPDNDGDGVVDGADQCPEEAEDVDGFEDADGCPDPDNDGDGIADLSDECPLQAEDLDGDADEDGCPEDDVAIVRPEVIEITQQINFDFDSDVLRSDAYPVLDSVARLLVGQPEIRGVRIEGHTSSEGTAAHNQALSEARAAAVLEALVERGVERARLTSQGFGSTRPLRDESEPGGPEANRRVEFHITERAD